MEDECESCLAVPAERVHYTNRAGLRTWKRVCDACAALLLVKYCGPVNVDANGTPIDERNSK